ncbi:hypothetical protein J2S00_000228 [Caldalkalibacillus uzonensis]|uniref:DUF7408 domain-containing protein n=2 Tax=Caldalkalibacillus uzonensis TaxID=353224 RepID=A0ABU0CMZ3_9BACI|nr:hypothetical protein [Caldalkalibacillus uzonensis]
MSVSRMRPNTFRCLVCALVAIIVASLLLTSTIFADEQVKLEVKVGFGGVYKPASWVPVQVKVTNMGEDIEGEVTIDIPGDFGGVYYRPVAISQGTTQMVSLYVPGDYLSGASVRLVQEGKEVAKTTLSGPSLSGEAILIGVLAEDPNTGSFLESLPKDIFHSSVRVVALNRSDIPERPIFLDGLDVIVINDFSRDQLTSAQVESIQEWTLNGGLLVLAGGPHYDKLPDRLKDISPVKVNGTVSLKELPGLDTDIADNIPLQRPLTISRTREVKGQVVVEQDENPLFVLGPAGHGHVLYVAYDLAGEFINAGEGHQHVWAELLSRTVVTSAGYDAAKMDPYDQYWSLLQAAERIPSLQLPDLSTISVLFGLYIVLVGPVLYWILKRRDKRGWMWMIVPGVACLIGLVIFFYGSMERTQNVLVHQVGILDLQQTEQAQLTAVSAIFVPKGGDYHLRYNETGGVRAAIDSYYRSYPPADTNRDVWITHPPQQADIVFKDVEYWSLRKALFETSLPDIGHFESQFVFQEGEMKGTVTNHTSLTIYDAKVVSGTRVHDIGTLEPGESQEVSFTYNPAQSGRDVFPPVERLLPDSIKTNVPQHNYYSTREYLILDMFNMHRPFSMMTDPFMIIGWTDVDVIDLEIADHSYQTDSLLLVKAALNVLPAPDGSVFVPEGVVSPALVDSDDTVEHSGDGYVIRRNGELVFDIKVEHPHMTVEPEEIYLRTWSHDNPQFTREIYNWKTETYEPLDEVLDQHTLVVKKQPDYLSEENMIRIRLSSSQDFQHIGIPRISWQGQVVE